MDKRSEVTIPLEFPMQLPDRKVAELTMRRPVMRDMLKFKDVGHELAADFALIAHLCGVLPEELENADSCDYEKLQAQLLRFRGVEG